MPRLTSPSGVTVNVSEAKAEQLTSAGYVPADTAKKAPAKKAPAKPEPKSTES